MSISDFIDLLYFQYIYNLSFNWYLSKYHSMTKEAFSVRILELGKDQKYLVNRIQELRLFGDSSPLSVHINTGIFPDYEILWDWLARQRLTVSGITENSGDFVPQRTRHQ